jgi:mRNA interferase HigB
VRVISLKPLRSFWNRYPDAQRPLRQWYAVTNHAQWKSLSDTRQDYPHADNVRTRDGDTLTVFNIGGNKYRLIARIRYDFQLINIRAILTHKEYNDGKWKA